MPTLALSMIVKNGASDLPECLASVAGVVDEIVIADTGSSDGSLELAAKLGAKALPVVWEDDYAKARNLSLAQVTADWVLTLDADERLDPEAGARIPALIANPSAAGYQVTIRNYVADAGKKVWDRPSHPNDGSYAPARQYPAYIDHENVRLFRREPEIYFTGCVHETVGWRIAETGGKVGPANFLIHHFGMVRGEETLRRKILFYRELGLKKIVDSPENAQAHFEVGIVEMENLGDVSSALPYFERACELNPKLGVAWFFAAKALFAQSQFAPALRALQSAERAGHAKAAVAELAGDAHYNLGDHPAAAESYRRALKREPQSASIESKLGLAASTFSDPSILTASAISGAPTGNTAIVVSNLATTSSAYSAAQATSSTPLATGTLTIQVGSGAPATVTIDNTNNTLDGLVQTINSANIGVTASVINDASGARLAIVSNTTGAPGDLTITPSTGALSFTKAVTGANASLTVNGIPVSSTSNTVSGVIPGITLNLNSADPNTTVTLATTANTSQQETAINNFVSAYNTVLSDLNKQFQVSSSTSQPGPLQSDSTLALAQSQILSTISFAMTGNGSVNTLADLGITMNNDGTLTVNSTTLAGALQTTPGTVLSFFSATNAGGFGQNLYDQVDVTLQELPLLLQQVNQQLASLG